MQHKFATDYQIHSGLPVTDPRAVSRQSLHAFSDLTKALISLQRTQTSLDECLTEFAALARGEDENSRDFLADLLGAAESMSSALCEMSENSSRLARSSEEKVVAEGITQIGRTAMTLGALGNIARSLTATYRLEGMVGFVDGLCDVAAEMRRKSNEASTCIQNFTNRRLMSARICAEAQKKLEQLVTALTAKLSESAQLESDEKETATEIEADARAIRDRSDNQLKVFVSAVQFSDRFSQWLDHISEIIESSDPRLYKLAASQARAAADELSQVAAETSGAMDILAENARRGSGLFSAEEINLRIGRNLRVRSEASSFIVKKMKELEPAIHKVRDIRWQNGAIITKLRDDFARLEEVSNDVGQAGVNSVLLASRAGSATQPVKTISVEVWEKSRSFQSAIAMVGDALKLLTEKDEAQLEKVFDRSEALQSSINFDNIHISSVQDRFNRLTQMRKDAARVAEEAAELIRDVQVCLEQVSAVCGSLRRLATNLDSSAVTEPPDVETLSRIYATFTTDEERNVHALLYPESVPNAGNGDFVNVDKAAEGLDDFFF